MERRTVMIAPGEFQEALAAARAHAGQIERDLGRERGPAVWLPAPYDPNELLQYFPLVRLKEGYRLDSYQFIAGGNGNGFVFVVPEGRKLPPPPADLQLGWRQGIIPALQEGGSLPPWVHREVEPFLEPDGPPLSYLQCSLLIRELYELGAVWHGGFWSTHKLVTSEAALHEGKWNQAPPARLLPQVELGDPGSAIVQFYTKSSYVQEQLCCHTDVYSGGTRTESKMETVAVGGPGFIY